MIKKIRGLICKDASAGLNIVGHFLVDKVLAFKSRDDGRVILGDVRHQLSLLRGEHGNGQRIHREIGLQYHPEIGIGLDGIFGFSR